MGIYSSKNAHTHTTKWHNNKVWKTHSFHTFSPHTSYSLVGRRRLITSQVEFRRSETTNTVLGNLRQYH
jgi:hypothetical protein